jgi:predicted ATPase
MLKDQFIISFEILKENIKSHEEYPYNLPVVKHLEEISLHKNVTFFV